MAFYRCMGGNGGGTTPTSITPSNSSPAAMSSGGVYQPTANGYAIESYDSKTPSDSTPPTVASGDIVKMGGAGYLYATEQSGGLDPTDMSINAATVSTSGYTTTIDDGDYVVVVFRTNAPTGSYSMDYIKNYQVTRIRDWSEITVSVSGTTLTVTRQSTASTVYIMKLS